MACLFEPLSWFFWGRQNMIILEIRLNGELLYKVGGSDLTRSSILINAWGFLGED